MGQPSLFWRGDKGNDVVKGVWSGKRSHCWAQIEFLIPDLFSFGNFPSEQTRPFVCKKFPKEKKMIVKCGNCPNVWQLSSVWQLSTRVAISNVCGNLKCVAIVSVWRLSKCVEIAKYGNCWNTWQWQISLAVAFHITAIPWPSPAGYRVTIKISQFSSHIESPPLHPCCILILSISNKQAPKGRKIPLCC